MSKWLIGGCVLVTLACSACAPRTCPANVCTPQPRIVTDITMPLNAADRAAEDGALVTDEHGNTYRLSK